MRHHHLGSGRRTVVHPDWETSQATVVAGFMTQATITLRKPGATTIYDDNLGRTVSTPFPPFALNVPANITPIMGGGAASGVVEEQVYVLGYRVSVARALAPTTTQLDEGIQIYVVSCSDPLLVGVTMHVTEIVRGAHRFQRDLIADINS
jgi:hypothetical protein